MTVKRILIAAPLVLLVFLLQSFFWVPTYEQQTRGNPERLDQYITASIGDASLLNPILSADSASSQIESMVFEGLIDRDKDLSFRGRLAESWEVSERAYFYVNEAFGVSAETVAALIRQGDKQKIDPEVRASLSAIERVRVKPGRDFQRHLESGGQKVELQVHAPPRVELLLEDVNPELFDHLEQLLGDRYFSSFDPLRHVIPEREVPEDALKGYAREFLPAVEHNPVLRFHLRPGVRFHDGHLFDAGDVKFTYEAIMDPANLSPRIADYEPVKAVEVVDPLTVRIVYKRLYSTAIASWGIGILPEHLLNEEALREEARERGLDPGDFGMRQSRFNRHPVGCGPFVFREWKSDQYIVLDGFDRYWEGAPNYGEYMFRIIPDVLTQEMEFYAGTLDSYNVQPHQVERLESDQRFQSFSGTAFGYTYIGYNMGREPFDDRRVRRALGMAIDVDKIIDYVLYGQGERITGPFVKQTDYYNNDIAPVPYDPEGALELLAEAGWHRNDEGWLEKDGRRMQFTLITNSGNDLRKAVLAIAQDAWKRIGIDVRTDLLEWSVFIQERVNKSDFDALILGWQMSIEPDLYQIWHSSQTHPHQLNFVGFEHPEADELILKIRRTYDQGRQVDDCHRLHEIIAREQPYTFLYVSRWTAVLDRRIVIREMDEGGNVHYRKIEPTQTGDYTFHFNKWIKLPEAPDFALQG